MSDDEHAAHAAVSDVEVDGSGDEAIGDALDVHAKETKLFVGSLALDVDDIKLRSIFESVGELVECKVMVEPLTQHTKGYGFVTFRHAHDARRAIQALNGTQINGRTITVEYPKRSRDNWAAQREADRRARLAEQFREPPPPVSYQELPFDKANKMDFYELCQILDKIRGVQGINRKLDTLFNKHLVEYMQGTSWYPIMRLVLPDYDRERPRYNLKESALAKLIIRALGFRPNESVDDVVRILKWKDPTVMQQYKGITLGDFPSVLREVLERRGFAKTSSKLSVGEVNELLDQLHGASSEDERLPVMTKFIQSCNSSELYWIARIILKDMNCGLKADSVLKRYHRDAVDAITATGDLRRVIAELSDPTVSRAYTVELFQPFTPMLANRVSMDKATDRLGDFVIEPKLDGDRMLVHIDKTQTPPKIMMFTRNMNDYTTRYGSPELFNYFNSAFDCSKIIVDGEMLAWDDENQQVMDFGQTTTVANEMNSGASYTGKRWLYYVCFDVLMVDDRVVVGESLRSRRKRLQDVIRPIAHRFEMVEAQVITEVDLDRRHAIVMTELDKMIQSKGEGLVLKSLQSAYVSGERGRKLGYWVKVKPEHVNGLQEELDCLILGGYYAEGARRASSNEMDPSTFLVGVPGRIGDQSSHSISLSITSSSSSVGSRREKKLEFFCLAKVGSGYRQDQLRDIREKLRPFFVKTNSGVKPPHFALPRKKDDVPDLWIPPEKSIVVQITGAELVPCEWFSSNYTLRFPRITRIREDKSYLDCTPFSEVERFAKDFQQGSGLHGRRRAADISRLDAGKVRGGGMVGSISSRRRLPQSQVLRAGATEHLAAVEIEDDAPLDGFTCFVYPSPSGFQPVKNHPEILSQEDVETYLKRKGAKVVKAAPAVRDNNFLCLASEKAVKSAFGSLKSVLRTESNDVFKMDFIISCCEEGRSFGEPEFSDYLIMSRETRAGMVDLDEFGDHYFQESDALSLERCLDAVGKRIKVEPSTIDKAYEELAADEDDPLAIGSFKCRGMFVHIPGDPSDDTKFSSLLVKLQGGMCVTLEDRRLSHVVLIPTMEDKVNEILERWQTVGKSAEAPEILRMEFLMAIQRSNLTWDLFPERIQYVIHM